MTQEAPKYVETYRISGTTYGITVAGLEDGNLEWSLWESGCLIHRVRASVEDADHVSKSALRSALHARVVKNIKEQIEASETLLARLRTVKNMLGEDPFYLGRFEVR